ncbi:MAG: hypothetical protein ACJASY_000241 [Halioglobus sp.]
MSYWIILFVVAVALAPLAHFVPSKSQRRVSRLREYAAVKGLFVEFRDPPGHGSGRTDSRTGHTIYYGKRIRSRGQGPQSRVSWRADSDGWTEQVRGSGVPKPLLELPPGIVGASADLDSCGIYWSESGEEAEIDKICEVLESLSLSLYA